MNDEKETMLGDFARIVRGSNGQQVLFYKEDTHDRPRTLHCVVSFPDYTGQMAFEDIPADKFATVLGKVDVVLADRVLAQLDGFTAIQENVA